MIGGTKNEKVFQLWKEGVRAMLLPYDEADMNTAEERFRQAIELEATQQTGKATTFDEARAADLGYPRAWSRYGYVIMTRFIEGWMPQKVLEGALEDALSDADEFTARSVRLDDTDYDVHWDRAFFYQMMAQGRPKSDFDQSLNEYARAQELNDGNEELRVEAAEVYVSIGEPDTALGELRRAGRVINHEWYWWDVAWAYYFKARLDPACYDVALEQFRSMHWQPGDPRYVFDSQLLKAAIHAQKADIHKTKAETYEGSKDPEQQAKAPKERKRQASEEQLRDAAMAHFRAKKDDPSMRDGRDGAEWDLRDERRARRFAHPEADADREHWLRGCQLAGLK